jgi:predicted nucleic acid-binding protein
MTFADLPSGEALFLDANVLVYYFNSHSVFGPPCQELVKRVENGDVAGFTSTPVLSELAHRLMTSEASSLFGWTTKIVDRLKHDPAAVGKLSRFRQAIAKVPQLGIRVLTIPEGLVETAAGVSQSTGLLSNDALIIAVMQANGLTNLASHDADFDRVPGLTRYAPA